MKASGIKPQFLSKLGENGVHLPPQFFQLEPERGATRLPSAPDGLRQGIGMRRALVFVAGLRPCSQSPLPPVRRRPRRAVRIAQIDTSRYPLITAVVIAPGSDRLRQVPLHGQRGRHGRHRDADGRRRTARPSALRST